MSINVPPLIVGLASLLPAALVLYFAFGRYDGYFRDNIVFLYFMGGLGLGSVLAFVAIAFLLFSAFPLLFVLFFPPIVEVLKTIILNRRKWASDRHVIFNGGALGAGVGVMLALGFGFRTVHTTDWRPAIDIALLAVGFVFTHFATGALVGLSVYDRRPIRGSLAAAVAAMPLALALEEWYRGYLAGAGFALLWPIVAAAAGLGAFWYARRAVLPQGLEPAARHAMRREERRERSPD